MITKHIHKLTIVVPEALITQANNLALIIGEAEADISTFKTAGWVDSNGDKYAVCSGVFQPESMNILKDGVPEENPKHTKKANKKLAKDALKICKEYKPKLGKEGVIAAEKSTIIVIADEDPLSALAALGVSQIPSEY
jgi:hypothetical protein